MPPNRYFEFGWPQIAINIDTKKPIASGHSHEPIGRKK